MNVGGSFLNQRVGGKGQGVSLANCRMYHAALLHEIVYYSCTLLHPPVLLCVIVWSAINQFLGCEFFLLRYHPHLSFASQLTFICSRIHSHAPWQPGWSCKVHHLVYHTPLGVVLHVLLHHASLVVHQFYIADGQSCIADCTATHDLGLVHHC